MTYQLECSIKDNKIRLREMEDFNLLQTIECGQCFRWNREVNGSYTIQAFTKAINVSQENNEIVITNSSLSEFEEIWIKYFDIQRDYGEIKKILAENDPIMGKAISFGEGIRLLNQDEWETLVSFLISQNSNIPRIKGTIKSLCENFGYSFTALGNQMFFTFPTPLEIASCDDSQMDVCKLGYRKSYISETAKAIANDHGKRLYNLKNGNYEAALKYLLELPGVGPKVANCTMLFSMEKYESFPIDVWVKRVMGRLYGLDEKDLKGIEQFAAEKFGKYGGFAQQYLFYYIRENKLI
ncbi:MAG: DNA glycosylase [Eubacteriales bacterium]